MFSCLFNRSYASFITLNGPQYINANLCIQQRVYCSIHDLYILDRNLHCQSLSSLNHVHQSTRISQSVIYNLNSEFLFLIFRFLRKLVEIINQDCKIIFRVCISQTVSFIVVFEYRLQSFGFRSIFLTFHLTWYSKQYKVENLIHGKQQKNRVRRLISNYPL